MSVLLGFLQQIFELVGEILKSLQLWRLLLSGEARIACDKYRFRPQNIFNDRGDVSLELLGSLGIETHVQHTERVEERDVNFHGQFGMQDELDLLLKELVDGRLDLLEVDGCHS